MKAENYFLHCMMVPLYVSAEQREYYNTEDLPLNEAEPLTMPLYASLSLLDKTEPYKREKLHNDANPAGEAGYNYEFKMLSRP